MHRLSWMLLVVSVCPLLAQEEAPPKSDPMAAMRAHAKACKEAIARLQLAGTWELTEQHLVTPMNPKASTHKARAVNTLLLNGTHLQTRHSGTHMGQPYDAMGLWSYDLKTKRYLLTWIDGMGWRGVYAGAFDESGKVLTLRSTAPQMGMTAELVWTFKGDGTHSWSYSWVKEGERITAMTSEVKPAQGASIGVGK